MGAGPSVQGASGYEVQFSTDEVFTDEDETVPRVGTELTYRREGLKPETDFWLRVRSVAGSGDDRQTSAWSASVPGMTAKTAAASGSDRPPGDGIGL